MTFGAAGRELNGEHYFQIFVRSYDSELHSLDVPSDGIVRDVIDIARAAGLTDWLIHLMNDLIMYPSGP